MRTPSTRLWTLCPAGASVLSEALRRELRLAWVLAQSQLAIDFGSSRLGYAWTVVRPFATFAILYTVFGRFLHIGGGLRDYTLYMLIGVIVWAFFSESTRAAMISLVAQRALLRHIPFPVRAVPLSALAVTTVTFAIELLVLFGFAGWRGISPGPDWLWLVLLLLELFAFSFAVSLLLAATYVRLRDIGEIWAVALQAFFYLTPIIYPLSRIPFWAQKLELVSPVAQAIEDFRSIILGRDSSQIPTVTDVFGPAGRLIPLAILALLLLAAFVVFRRESPLFAERA